MIRAALSLLIGISLWGQYTPIAGKANANSDAAGIAYTPAGTSTTRTTLAKRLDRSHDKSVLDYMTEADQAAVVSGTNPDVTSAIKAAFADTTTAGKTLHFPKGTYKFSGATSAIRTVSGDITFEAGAVIDAKTCTADNVLKLLGSRGTCYAQVAAIAQGRGFWHRLPLWLPLDNRRLFL